jgi:hypothetical protein
MRELQQIIERLQAIDRSIADEDQYINNYRGLVTICETFLAEAPIPVEWKIQYLAPMEAKLKTINSLNSISIDPKVGSTPAMDMTLPPKPTKTKPRTAQIPNYSSSDMLDIYLPLAERKKLTKQLTKAKPKVTKANTAPTVTDDTSGEGPAYVELVHQEKSYYIDTRPQGMGNTYFVYHVKSETTGLNLVGQLKGDTLTLLTADDGQSETLKLKTDSKLVSSEVLRGYAFE